MATDMAVATIIMNQVGPRGWQFMIGAKNLIGTANSFRFQFMSGARNGTNVCQVTLDPSDTYTVEFIRSHGMTWKVKSSQSDVYAEDLRDLFERSTGLSLSF